MIYNDIKIDIKKCYSTEGYYYIPLPTGETVCIPEEDATAEEIELIYAIKADIESREIPNSQPVIASPTLEERINALENAILTIL